MVLEIIVDDTDNDDDDDDDNKTFCWLGILKLRVFCGQNTTIS